MDSVKYCVKNKHYSTFDRAKNNSDKLLETANLKIKEFFEKNKLPLDKFCFSAVGSVGRHEALEASDLDLIPIAADQEALELYSKRDVALRKWHSEELSVKVSKGKDLTKATSIKDLIKAEAIGGSKDSSAELTKRVLLVTESSQAGGEYQLSKIRRALLDEYASKDRTSGRHFLSFCNDISRYYKTLCIEYKAKIDEESKDWCTRNIKLRHSRKIWYFSSIALISFLAEKHPQGNQDFKNELLEAFNLPPIERLAEAFKDTQPLGVGRVLESYAIFLEFMSTDSNRKALSEVVHEKRYEATLENPFLAMKLNSDLLQQEIIGMIEEAGPAMRARIMSWFLL